MKLLLALGLYFRRAVVVTVVLLAPSAHSELFYAKDEALKEAFPLSDAVEEEVFILTEEQKSRVENIAQSKLDGGIFTIYKGKTGGVVDGYAIIDSRIIRTMSATYMVTFSPQGKVRKIVVLAFNEPSEYLPQRRWFETLEQAVEGVAYKSGVPPIAGATLSVDALSAGVRVVRALFKVLVGKEG